MSLLPWIGAVDDAEGSWFEFWILTLIIMSLFGSWEFLFWIWVFYVEFERAKIGSKRLSLSQVQLWIGSEDFPVGAKNPHVLIALNWDCWWHWRFLIRDWDLDSDFIKFVWVLGIFVLNLGFFMLSLKVQRTLMPLFTLIWALDDAGGSILEFGILTWISVSLLGS